jgi:hypothetical protein
MQANQVARAKEGEGKEGTCDLVINQSNKILYQNKKDKLKGKTKINDNLVIELTQTDHLFIGGPMFQEKRCDEDHRKGSA